MIQICPLLNSMVSLVSIRMIRRTLFVIFSLFSVSNAGQCTGDDIKIWKNQKSFSEEFRKIAKVSLGKSSIVLLYMKKSFPSMTPHCMQCHADTLACGVSHCKTQCMQSQTSLDCRLCIDTHCFTPYKECVGVEDDDDLPIPPWKL